MTFEILLALERSQREGSMCCRLCFVGTSEEESKSYQTGELKHIPSLKIDFNQEDWADHLYANIKGEYLHTKGEKLYYSVCNLSAYAF